MESGVILLLEHAAQLIARIAARGKDRWVHAICAILIGLIVVIATARLWALGAA